jgi:hypothetical protein
MDRATRRGIFSRRRFPTGLKGLIASMTAMLKQKKSQTIVTSTETPQEIYAEALRERKSKNPLDKRQACEKAWLAVTLSVDDFLASKGRVIQKGTAEAHVKRIAMLSDLAQDNNELIDLKRDVSEVAENLHGACYYGGFDSAYNDILLKKTVRRILEKTGHPVDEIDD